MSLSSTLRRAAAPAALAVMTAFAAANDAHADVAFGCRKPDAVPALQQQVLNNEGMVPVAARFTAVGNSKNDGVEWLQEAIMMNPQTGVGLRWSKFSDGTVCVMTKYREMQLYNNDTFDETALLQVQSQKVTQVKINQAIIRGATSEKMNPMFRAIAHTPTNTTYKLPPTYIEYMLGDPVSQKGVVLASTTDGQPIERFTETIPTPKEAPVKFGAVYTDKGRALISSSRVASAGAPVVALNK